MEGGMSNPVRQCRSIESDALVWVAGRTNSILQTQRIGNEVETLYTNGPPSGGEVTKSAHEVLAVQSVLLPRELARPTFTLVET
ncbi:hypothetical protein [Bradyrhizobium nanningense]|uniref:hypothetical protein n=1 Tax=Bradyrhizobium nanningense TaxID=1325118 RepID=UPI0019D715BA